MPVPAATALAFRNCRREEAMRFSFYTLSAIHNFSKGYLYAARNHGRQAIQRFFVASPGEASHDVFHWFWDVETRPAASRQPSASQQL